MVFMADIKKELKPLRRVHPSSSSILLSLSVSKSLSEAVKEISRGWQNAVWFVSRLSAIHCIVNIIIN